VQRADDALLATLTSVPPTVDPVSPTDLDEALAALGWRREDLDRSLPPRIAAAGARHLVLAAGTRARLRELAYDVDRLTRLMRRAGWTTVHLVWRESALVHHARDPFPVGGVIEDPATGAAAAAYGAYLRDVDELPGAARFTIHQGDDLGRPSQLFVELVADDDRVRVSGYAVALDG
jgi:PhzF family phenazine biosynthesis protein